MVQKISRTEFLISHNGNFIYLLINSSTHSPPPSLATTILLFDYNNNKTEGGRKTLEVMNMFIALVMLMIS